VTVSGTSGTVTVALASSNTAVAQVPASIVVPIGATSGAFTIATSAVATATAVTITATAGGRSATATLQVTPTPTGSSAIVNDPGCLATVLPRNDDGSTPAVTLPFNANFFGTTSTFLFVNNNGNVTFNQPLPTFTPFRITALTPPIIAPFFADVDTRASGTSPVTYSFGPITFNGRNAMCVNWVNVGYFANHADKLNSFQLLLVDRSDVNPGDFDIVMNYNRILWETGDASGGSNGFGGVSAGAGYSAGTGNAGQFFEFPGSLVNGALLDTNGTTGLSRTSRNSLIVGRHVFEVRNGNAPTGGSIAGSVHDAATPPNGLASAPVQVCRISDGRCIFQTLTGASGQFIASGIPAGDYNVTAFPPAGSTLSRATVGPVHVTAGVTTQVDLTLRGPTPPPAGTGIGPNRGGGSGIPIVYWAENLTLTTTGCPGGSASYVIAQGITTFASGPMTEGPAGTYTATVPALFPNHGTATVTITVHCPNAPDQVITFDIYVDPSGVVHDPQGHPIDQAVVSLMRADSPTGPFDLVPNGSAIMSPQNRQNPDLTDATGRFGWDVIAGFYVVRAQKDGCTALDGSPFVESEVLTIPPAVLNLDLTLSCAMAPPPPPATPPVCALTAVVAGPPKQLQITVQDPDNGIQSVEVTESNNAAVVVPTFTPGDTTAMIVLATKIDPTTGSQVALRITDTNGAVTDCDPVVPGEAPMSDSPSAGCSVASGQTGVGAPGLLCCALLVGLGVMRRRNRRGGRP
jgi:hypothetical protein